MISGAMAAVILALLFLVATVGAVIVGVWSSGTMESPLFGEDSACFSFLFVVLGLVYGLMTPVGLLVGIISLVGVIIFLRYDYLRMESFFVLFNCGVTAGFRASHAIYELCEARYGAIITIYVLSVILYLALRIPVWIEDYKWRRLQNAVPDITPVDNDKYIYCPVCHGRQDISSLTPETNRCRYCESEFLAEDNKENDE